MLFRSKVIVIGLPLHFVSGWLWLCTRIYTNFFFIVTLPYKVRSGTSTKSVFRVVIVSAFCIRVNTNSVTLLTF